MLQNPNQTRKPVSAPVPIPRNPQPNALYIEGLKSAGQAPQVNRGPEKPANVHSSQQANYSISFGSNPNPSQIQPSVSGSSQVEGGGSVGGQVGQPYNMQMYPNAAPPRSNHPMPQVLPSIKSWRFVSPNAGSGSGGNRGQRQPTQNYPPQQQQPGFMVQNPFIQQTQIYIPQPTTYIHNTHRMPNSNQQPQQFVPQQIQYPQNFVNNNSQPQQLPYMSQPYQSGSYTQPNQQHQSVVTHVTSTQPPNNPYQTSAQPMLVQNPPQQPQQREKKIIRIIDPSTGKSVNDEIRTNRMSSPSVTSTNQAEEVKDQSTEVADDTKSKVCQEFAALVAARCRNDPSQTSQAEDSKSEEISKKEAEAVEKSEEPKVEKPEEVKPEEEITVESEEKPNEEIKHEEAIVEEKPEKTVVEEKSSETEDKDSSKGKKTRKNKEQNSPTTNTTGAIAVDIEIEREERPSLSPPTSEIPEEIKASSLVESSPEINDKNQKIEEEISEENGVTPLSESPQVVTEDDSEIQEKPVDDETENTDLQRSDTEEQSTDPPCLKYDYKENQWSPLNTEGKKQYDRDFLMRLQYDDLSKKKPIDLPKLDIILTQPICNDQSNASTGMERQDFIPNYFQQQPFSTGRMSGSMHRQKSKDFNKNRVESRKVIQISREKEVQFVRTANAYRPHYLGDGSDEDRHDEVLFRNVRAMLNKLTPQNFNSLISKFKELEINSEARMVGVIKLIFQKAIDEPAFSVAYANLCKSLSNILTNTKMQSKEGKEFTFRSGLLNRCQEQFEKNRHDDEILEKKRGELELAESPEKRKELVMALEEHETLSKRKYLGNIRFIGELFKLKMLTENIMHGCLFELLKSHDEEKLECLCKLMKTIGKECDHKQAKPRMDQYFTQMQKIVEQKKTCSRVRFMLQDVIELRKNLWVPRRDENAPKTIAQVREEMEREAQEKAVHLNAAANNASKRRSITNVPGMNNRHGSSGPNAGDESGWHNVQPRYSAQRANEMDRSRMMNIASQHSNKMTDGNIQLGPSKAGWGRGASGGRSHNSSQDDSSATSGANKFSVLQQHDELRPVAHVKGASRSAQLPPRHQKNFSGQQRGLNSRPSAEQERGKREALEMARTVATPPRGNSRESSRSRSGQRVPVDKAASTATSEAPQMSDDELERRIKTLVDEYLQVHDLNDTKAYVKEMLTANVKSDAIVNKILLSVLERSTEARRTIGDMLNTLMKDTECSVSAQSFTAALASILEFAEDMEIDIPKIWGYIAELISPTVANKSVLLTNIFEACLPMRKENSCKTGELFAALLHQCASMIGPGEVFNMWQQSDLKWDTIVQDVDTFIKKNKLEFTTTGGRRSRNSSEMLTVKELSKGIRDIFRKSRAEEMFAWIEDNVSEEDTKKEEFIRNLVYGLCEVCTVGYGAKAQFDKNKCKDEYKAVLQKYLDSDKERMERLALLAIQNFSNDLEHPPNLFETVIEHLYDDEMISEEAVLAWDKDDNNEPGFGVCRAGSQRFVDWLKSPNDNDESR